MTEKIFLQGIKMIQVINSTTSKEYINLTSEQLRLYFLLLQDLENEKFLAGINKLLRNYKYVTFPSPSQIREFCDDIKNLEEQIFSAKKNLVFGIKKYGAYSSVAFDDPILHLIIRNFGGWKKLCQMKTSELDNFLKFEFDKSYKFFSERKNENIPAFFHGITGNENVKIVGNAEKYEIWTKKFEDEKLLEIKK